MKLMLKMEYFFYNIKYSCETVHSFTGSKICFREYVQNSVFKESIRNILSTVHNYLIKYKIIIFQVLKVYFFFSHDEPV